MPCYDPRDNSARWADGLEREVEAFKKALNNEKDKSAALEGALCALMRELDRRGLSEEVLKNADKLGDISINAIWEAHKLKDTERLSKVLEKYSFDEKAILKKLLNESE